MADRQHESERAINNLTTEVAVIHEKISTMKEAIDQQSIDLKSINKTMQSFTFVKEDEFAEKTTALHKRIDYVEDRVDTLERNTSVLVKIKNILGERGTQLLVLILLALIIFGAYLILKHAGTTEILNGATGGH